jgi:hypothetical protein
MQLTVLPAVLERLLVVLCSLLCCRPCWNGCQSSICSCISGHHYSTCNLHPPPRAGPGCRRALLCFELLCCKSAIDHAQRRCQEPGASLALLLQQQQRQLLLLSRFACRAKTTVLLEHPFDGSEAVAPSGLSMYTCNLRTPCCIVALYALWLHMHMPGACTLGACQLLVCALGALATRCLFLEACTL